VRVTLASEPAYPGRENEDFAAATPRAVVLLNGAGSPAGVDPGCVHGVAWYSRDLGARLLARVTAADGVPLADCLAEAIAETAALHAHTCDLVAGGPAATVVAIRVTGSHLDYLVLADSTVVLDRFGEVQAITDDREARAGVPHRAPMDATANRTPEHDQALRDYTRAIRRHRNTPEGFWVTAGEPHPAYQAIVGRAPLASLRAVALLSDRASRRSTDSVCSIGPGLSKCSPAPVPRPSFAAPAQRRPATRTFAGGLAARPTTTPPLPCAPGSTLRTDTESAGWYALSTTARPVSTPATTAAPALRISAPAAVAETDPYLCHPGSSGPIATRVSVFQRARQRWLAIGCRTSARSRPRPLPRRPRS
jgi:hypothetical protein